MVAYVRPQLARSAHGLDTTHDDQEWRQRGVCAKGEYNRDLWTSPTFSDLGQARWICLRECPVQQQCAAWAVKHPELAEGAVYGGYYYLAGRPGRDSGQADHQPALVLPGSVPSLVRPERLRTTGRPRRSTCGSYAGYRNHQRDHTRACEPCMQAMREYDREWKARGSSTVSTGLSIASFEPRPEASESKAS